MLVRSLAGMVLSIGSILVLEFETRTPGANIKTGGDALWWGFVTITTVGYGDFYPISTFGRLTGIFVMFAGIGIIGALASILASLLVSPSTADESAQEVAPAAGSGINATATNAIIEGKFARSGFVTTDGFRDLLEIARQVRPTLYDTQFEKAKPLVPRDRAVVVGERLGPKGEVLRPLEIGRASCRERVSSVV